MTWQERMRQAMDEMQKACDEGFFNNGCSSCDSCPFSKYCEALEKNSKTYDNVFCGLNW